MHAQKINWKIFIHCIASNPCDIYEQKTTVFFKFKCIFLALKNSVIFKNLLFWSDYTDFFSAKFWECWQLWYCVSEIFCRNIKVIVCFHPYLKLHHCMNQLKEIKIPFQKISSISLLLHHYFLQNLNLHWIIYILSSMTF